MGNNRNKGRKTPEEMIDKWEKLYDEGVSCSAIAQRFGMTASTVQKKVRERKKRNLRNQIDYSSPYDVAQGF